MKFEIDIDDNDIKYQVKKEVFKRITPYNVKNSIDAEVEKYIVEETKRQLDEFGFIKLIIEGVIKYLEKYQIREVVGMIKNETKN